MTDEELSPLGRELSIVYIIDDDQAVREALEDLLASVSLPARSFESVQDFVSSELVDAPGCLVLDVRIPGQSGMVFLGQMAQQGLCIPTIVITGHGDIAMGVQAMKDGAIDFLTKPFRDQDILDAVYRGGEIDRLRRGRETADAELRDSWMTLTPGEQDVVRFVANGFLNKQIATELGLSEITVKVRRARLMKKLDVKNVAELVRLFDRIQAES